MKQILQKNAFLFAGLALLSLGVFAMPAYADHAMETIAMVQVDVQTLSTGYRISKIIGSDVVNDSNEKIGKIDDVIVSPNDNKSAYVIISVGGWLGMGTHFIALPYDDLRITNTQITVPGATKDGLKNLPEFKYSVT